MASNDLRFAKNHFVSFLPTKIPLEFWNFGILFCKSLISLKKVDSNFTLHICPLYIRTSKFQFCCKIPRFQFAWNRFQLGWNLGIISPTRETLSHRPALTRARRHITGFIGPKKSPTNLATGGAWLVTSTVHRMRQLLGAVWPHWVRMCPPVRWPSCIGLYMR